MFQLGRQFGEDDVGHEFAAGGGGGPAPVGPLAGALPHVPLRQSERQKR